MDIAQAAIDNGSDVTQSLLAQYLTAGQNKNDITDGQNKNDITDRNDDETDASAADGAVETKTEAEQKEAEEDEVMALVAKDLGADIDG